MTIIILCTGFGVERTSVVRHSTGSYSQAKQLLLKNECQVVSTANRAVVLRSQRTTDPLVGWQAIAGSPAHSMQIVAQEPSPGWLTLVRFELPLIPQIQLNSSSTCFLLRRARSRLHQSIPSEDLKSHLMEDVGCQGCHRIQRAHQRLANTCLDLYPDWRGHQRSGVTSIPDAPRLVPGVNVARWMVLGTGGEHFAD